MYRLIAHLPVTRQQAQSQQQQYSPSLLQQEQRESLSSSKSDRMVVSDSPPPPPPMERSWFSFGRRHVETPMIDKTNISHVEMDRKQEEISNNSDGDNNHNDPLSPIYHLPSIESELIWENPSYLVKNLDSGESYHVEEIEQHYNLITLEDVAASKIRARKSLAQQQIIADHNDTTAMKESSSDEYEKIDASEKSAILEETLELLSFYTTDETENIVIEEDPVAVDEDLEQGDNHANNNIKDSSVALRTRSTNFTVDKQYAQIQDQPLPCMFNGCTEIHHRPSGYCTDHEIIAKEDEDLRAQACYLIPVGTYAELVGITGHGFVYDAQKRLYTVYIIEMKSHASGTSWVIYRRYAEFKALHDELLRLKTKITSMPSYFPPKKLLRSLDVAFIRKRQRDLAQWLGELLKPPSNQNVGNPGMCYVNGFSDSEIVGVDDNDSVNPHSLELVRRFLTEKADQPPLMMTRVPVKSQANDDARATSVNFMLADEDKTIEPVRAPTKQPTKRVTLEDFTMLQVIGRGSFGKVVLVGHNSTSTLFAMKILSKENIVKRKQVEHTRTERRVLGYTKHPFIVGLHYAFQTPQRLYLVLDYCPGGELFYHLSRLKKLPEHMACFYAAEITCALDHLHSLGVVYRDLKPENILLTREGHIKLADFGLAKEGITTGTSGTHSLCGTPEYLPPEILDRQGHGTAVDWWNLGMVLYEMLTGLPPWYTNDRKKLFERIRTARLTFPPYVSRRAESLIRQLLTRNPADRLGAHGASQVKNHLFFEHIDWEKLMNKEISPPFRPCHSTSKNAEAPMNFEAEFTRLPLPSIEDSQSNFSGSNGPGGNISTAMRLLRADSDTFKGFTYDNPTLLEEP